MSSSNLTLSQRIRGEVDALPYPGWVCRSYAAYNERLGIQVTAITSQGDPLHYEWCFLVTVGKKTELVRRWDTLMEAVTYFEFGGKV